MTSRTFKPLSLSVRGTGEQLAFSPTKLIIAGFTGRDESVVRAHLQELEQIGVAPPPRVPMFYELNPTLLTCSTSISVSSPCTSGEAEPVLLWQDGRKFLGLGSDHTDREIEIQSIPVSKASAPKLLAREVLPLDDVLDQWDAIELVCHVDGADYQRGKLSTLLKPDDLCEKFSDGGPDLGPEGLMFCGTLPLETESFVYGSVYELEMLIPNGEILRHTYNVQRKEA